MNVTNVNTYKALLLKDAESEKFWQRKEEENMIHGHVLSNSLTSNMYISLLCNSEKIRLLKRQNKTEEEQIKIRKVKVM